MTTTREILVKARDYIERGWSQGHYARTAAGRQTDEDDALAASWCPLGAIMMAAPDSVRLRDDAGDALCVAIGAEGKSGSTIPEWNDAAERTQADVLAAFDRAIANCEVP